MTNMLQVTLAAVKQKYDWSEDWKRVFQSLLPHLGKNGTVKKVFPLETMLDACGLDDALTALQAVKGHKNALRLFACYCARHAAPLFEKRYPGDLRLRKAIDVAEQFAWGWVPKEALNAARKSLREVRKDLSEDTVVTTTQIQMEELHAVLNSVATCINAEWYEYRATRNLDLEQLYLIVNDAKSAVIDFIHDVIINKNSCLFNSFHPVTALETVAEKLILAADTTLEVIVGDTVSILEKNTLNVPHLESVKAAAGSAVVNTVCETVAGRVTNLVLDAFMKDVTAKFRQLCRLEGEYGEVEAKEKNCYA
jgi:hypothetical protein